MLYVLVSIFLIITIIGSRDKIVLPIKEKYRKILDIVEIVFCFCVLALYRGGLLNIPDFDIYEEIHEKKFFFKDVGFGAFTYLVKLFGVDLNCYRLVCGIFGLIFIYLAIRKYLDKKGILLFLLLYFLYPYFMDSIQIRNYVAMSIFCYAFTFLVEDNKKGQIMFFLIMLLSISMQKTLLFFLPFIIFYKAEKNKVVRIILIVLVVCLMAIGLNKTLLANIASLLLKTVSSILVGIGEYLHIKTRYGWMFFWLISFTNLFITGTMYFVCKKKNVDNKLIKTVFWLNMYTQLALPLYVMDSNFYRIGRDITVLNSLAIVSYIRQVRQKNIILSKKFYYVLFVLVVIFSIILMQYVTIYREDLVKYFFIGLKQSWIFK